MQIFTPNGPPVKVSSAKWPTCVTVTGHLQLVKVFFLTLCNITWMHLNIMSSKFAACLYWLAPLRAVCRTNCFTKMEHQWRLYLNLYSAGRRAVIELAGSANTNTGEKWRKTVFKVQCGLLSKVYFSSLLQVIHVMVNWCLMHLKLCCSMTWCKLQVL